MSERMTSYEDLLAKRQQLIDAENSTGKPVEIRVAMGTCAIATGAEKIYNTIKETLEANPMDNVTLKATGCMGYCYAEPTVEVVGVGADPVMYGYVNEDIARRIVTDYVAKQEPVDARIDTCHVNAD
jgi:NADP-reducing hydrogenase subunit HndB